MLKIENDHQDIKYKIMYAKSGSVEMREGLVFLGFVDLCPKVDISFKGIRAGVCERDGYKVCGRGMLWDTYSFIFRPKR